MTENPKPEQSKTIFKEWLEKLQQESWQLELLISGFAIFGIYASRTLIKDLELYNEYEMVGESSIIVGLIVFVFKKGWLIFFINLIVHVILRGLWIGAIGLRYVSQEIDYDSLGYSDRFTTFLKDKVGSYDDFIEGLEKICSVLFAYTFLLFLLFASLMIFVVETLIIILIGQKIDSGSNFFLAVFGLIGFGYFVLGLVVFFDLITLGGFKRIKEKSISTIYYYIYRFYSFMTMSFLYRPLLYNFIDHKYTKRLFFLSIPYIFFIIIGNTIIDNNPNPYLPDKIELEASGKRINDYYYDDLRSLRLLEFPNEERKVNKQKLGKVSLDQFEINKSISSVFIRIDKGLNKILQIDSSINAYKKEGLSFRWFNYNLIEDKNFEKIQKLKSGEMTLLYEKRRKMTKNLKAIDQPLLRKTKDSLSAIITQKELYWNERIDKEEKSKLLKILNAYISNVSLHIDSTSILLDHCYFYTHPHFGEEGLRCFFNTDTLSKGHHLMKVEKKYINRLDSLDTETIFLPFIKL